MTMAAEVSVRGLARPAADGLAPRPWLARLVDQFLAADVARALLILGDPGSGKTAFLAQEAERLQSIRFFCGRSDSLPAAGGGGWTEPIRCARTISDQLVERFGEQVIDWRRFGIHADVQLGVGRVDGLLTGIDADRLDIVPGDGRQAALRATLAVGEVGPAGRVTAVKVHELRVDPLLALQELVVGPLRRAAEMDRRPLVLLLDALDEWDRIACPSDVLQVLLQAELPAHVRIVATARHGYALSAPSALLRVEDLSADRHAAAVATDLRRFLAMRAAAQGAALGAAAEEQLLTAAQGNFLYVDFMSTDVVSFDAAAAPDGLNAFYARELERLSDRLAREGLRSGLGGLLTALAVAREPLPEPLLARAGGLDEERMREALRLARPFIRTHVTPNGLAHAPYHLSFGQYVLRSPLFAGAEAAHGRMAAALAEEGERILSWDGASDYALRHLAAHAGAAGPSGAERLAVLLADCAYLAAKAARLGVPALETDVRQAEAAGLRIKGLHELVVEASLRSDVERAAGVSIAQGLAAAAAAVGDLVRARGFAALAVAPCVAEPAWSSGLSAASAAVGGFQTAGPLRHAAVAGDRLVLTGEEGGVEIWDLQRRARTHRLQIEGARLCQPSWDGGSLWVAVRHDDEDWALRRIRLEDEARLVDLPLDHGVCALAASACGAWMALGTDAGRVLLLDATTGRVAATRETGPHPVRKLRFEGDRLAALALGRKAVVWTVPGLRLHGFAYAPPAGETFTFADRTEGLALDLGRNRVAIGGEDGALMLIDIGGDRPSRIVRLGGWIDHVALLPEGTLAAGDSHGRLHLVGPEGGYASFPAHAAEILLVEPTSDPAVLATVDKRGEVRTWRIPSLADVAAQRAHRAPVWDLAPLPRRSVVSLGKDGALYQWSGDGALAAEVHVPTLNLEPGRLAPDGTAYIQMGPASLRRLDLQALDPEVFAAEPWPDPVPDKCVAYLGGEAQEVSVTADGSLAARDGPGGVELWDLDAGVLRRVFPNVRIAGRNSLARDGGWLVARTPRGLFAHGLTQAGDPVGLGAGELIVGPFATLDGDRVLICERGAMRLSRLDGQPADPGWATAVGPISAGAVSPDARLAALAGEGGLIEIRRLTDGGRLGLFLMRPRASVLCFQQDGAGLIVGDAGGAVHAFTLRGTDRGR